MKATETPGSCPFCGKKFDLSSDMEGQNIPKPGDASICIQCAGILIFDENMDLRKPTDQEYKVYSKMPDIKRIRTAVLLARQKPAKN